MASIEETPIPQPPQPLADLSGEHLALAVFRNPEEWLNYMRDLNTHAEDIQEFAAEIKDQLHEIDEAHNPDGEDQPGPPTSEPTAPLLDTDDNTEIKVTEYTLSVSSTIPISQISGIVIMPRGSPAFVVIGSFSAVIERRIETEVRKRHGGIESTKASLVRENEGDYKPVNRFIAFGNLDLDHRSCFDIIAEKPGYNADVKIEKLRRIWKGARPRDANGNRAELIFEKKKSYKRDVAFLIPLNMEPEYEAPCNLVCQKRAIMARPYYLGKEMKIVLHRMAKKPWDPCFTINPTAQTGLAANALRGE